MERLGLLLLLLLLSFGAAAGGQESNEESPALRGGAAARRLSAKYDLLTGDLSRTTNGQVPRVNCEPGYYRPRGGSNLIMITGQRLDGCIQCPRGTFGQTSGLTDRSCSGSCPLGTYSDRLGRTSVADCKPCPLGTYGAGIGLTTASCSGSCPAGRYTPAVGATDASACEACVLGLEVEPCSFAVLPRYDRRTKQLNVG